MLNPDFRDMLSALNEEGVEYLVVGAYALAAHGIPRATGDLDFWVRNSHDNVLRLLRALESFGAPTDELSPADLTQEDVVFQIGREPNRIDFLTSIDGVGFDEAWSDQLEVEIDGLAVRVLSRDQLIANKKAVGRPRDLADVQELEGQGPE